MRAAGIKVASTRMEALACLLLFKPQCALDSWHRERSQQSRMKTNTTALASTISTPPLPWTPVGPPLRLTPGVAGQHGHAAPTRNGDDALHLCRLQVAAHRQRAHQQRHKAGGPRGAQPQRAQQQGQNQGLRTADGQAQGWLGRTAAAGAAAERGTGRGQPLGGRAVTRRRAGKAAACQRGLPDAPSACATGPAHPSAPLLRPQRAGRQPPRPRGCGSMRLGG